MIAEMFLMFTQILLLKMKGIRITKLELLEVLLRLKLITKVIPLGLALKCIHKWFHKVTKARICSKRLNSKIDLLLNKHLSIPNPDLDRLLSIWQPTLRVHSMHNILKNFMTMKMIMHNKWGANLQCFKLKIWPKTE